MLLFLHYVFHSLRNKKSQVGFLVLWFVCKEKQGKCFNEGLAFLRSSTQSSACYSGVQYHLLNGRPLNTSCVHYLPCTFIFSSFLNYCNKKIGIQDLCMQAALTKLFHSRLPLYLTRSVLSLSNISLVIAVKTMSFH